MNSLTAHRGDFSHRASDGAEATFRKLRRGRNSFGGELDLAWSDWSDFGFVVPEYEDTP